MASDFTAEQLLALDDQSLARYLVNNWGPRQELDVEAIVDWNTTAEPQRDELIQRFKAVRPLAKAAQPIDYNELVAKLESISCAETETPLWDDEDLLFLQPTTCGGGKRYQTCCYHALVADGGRPPCPLDLLGDVYRQPAKHVELMKPWLGDPVFFTGSADQLGVFSRPLQRWRQFRRWQADNRGVVLPDDDQDLATFRKAWKALLDRGTQAPAAAADQNDDDDDDDDDDGQIEVRWRTRRDRRRWERDICREVGSFADGGFDEYVEAARRRLRTHGFTDHFQLLRDAARQDAPDTWVEYLGFECWWLDWREAELRRHTLQRDATWAELRRDGETDVDVLVYVEAARRKGRRWGPVELPSMAGIGAGVRGGRQRQQDETARGAGGSSRQSATRLREELADRFCRDREASRSAEAFRSSQVLLLAWARSQVMEVTKEAKRKESGAGPCGDETKEDEDKERERWQREIEENIMVARHRALLQIHIITAELARQAEQEDLQREKAAAEERG
ncbi:uncharacterized protein PpBr36_09346 [Pyricularia pennisetigena]|uniref:uncharacterized protein n=1 Tax=Pyricularia pennisetigena TaxID=1578925 RepID=UPI00114D8534|nr:uncharacterized protein PpBr36_09346 [Pyricularia pennisetigena]TLS21815.1 hypothetical protein PpBr36_09346 [Pyricularia pennisetigena]